MEEEDPDNDKEDMTGEDADTLDSTAMEGAMKINREGVYPKQIVPMSKKFVETLSPREARPILEREFWQYIKMIVLAIFQTRHSDKILDSTLDCGSLYIKQTMVDRSRGWLMKTSWSCMLVRVQQLYDSDSTASL